jgi:hypothetical protein
MAWRRLAHEAIASIVRPASAAAFVAEVLAVATTWGGMGWATWRRMDLGWVFWIGLGDQGAALAFGCCVAGVFLSILRESCGQEKLKDTNWCLMLNLATFILFFFLPALQK